MTVGKSDWPLVGLVALELLVVRALLFAFGYRATARVLAVVTPSPGRVVDSAVEPKSLARTVEVVAARIPVRTTCLTEALVCKVLLEKCGFETDLKIGVAKAEDQLEAHAWLVHGDEILVGATREDPGRFRRIADGFEP